VAPGLAGHLAEPTRQILIHLDTQAPQKDDRGGRFLSLITLWQLYPYFGCLEFFCGFLSPRRIAVAGGQKSLQMPKKEAKHGTQRLGIDEKRLITSTPKTVGGGDVAFVVRTALLLRWPSWSRSPGSPQCHVHSP